MSQKRQFLKSTSWLTAGNVFAKLISAVALPVLARILGPEQLGMYNFVTTTAQSGQSFMTLGTDVAMHRNGARVGELGNDAIGRLFGVGLSFTAVVGLATGTLLYLLRDPLSHVLLGHGGAGGWMAVAGLIIALQPLGVTPMLFMASLQEFRGYALRTILMLLLGNILTIVLAAVRGLDGAIAAAVLSALLQGVLSYLFVAPLLRRRGIRLRFDGYGRELRAMLSFGFPYYFGNTLLGSVVGIPIMGMLAKSGSMHDLGYLRVAQSMNSIISFIPSIIGPAVITHLTVSSGQQDAAYREMRSGHLRIVWMFLLIATTGFSLLMPVVIVPLFGETYRAAAVPSSILLWLGLMMGITTALVQQLLVSGRTVLIGTSSTSGVLLWLAASMWMIPAYTFNGYIGALIIGQGAGTVIVLTAYFLESRMEERRTMRLLLLGTGVSAAFVLVVITTITDPIVLVLLSFGFASLLSAAAYRHLLSQGERAAVRAMLRRLFPHHAGSGNE